MSGYVVTVTPNILDGTVVRWYRSVEHAEYGPPPLASASRGGVMVSGYLHELPAEVLAQANEAFEILRDDGPRELVQGMATHRRRNGVLVPVEREDA